MNDEYIKREDALNAFNNYFYAVITAKINNIPSADVAPVRHGKWMLKQGVFGAVYCSVCGYELRMNDTNYCTNCGAKMDGDSNETD